MNEIQLAYQPYETLYATVRNSNGLIWNTESLAFETYTDADVLDYGIAMTEQGVGSGYYEGDFPSGITQAGTYYVVIYVEAGEYYADGDTVAGSGEIVWDGSEPVYAPSGDDLISLSYAKQYSGVTGSLKDSLFGDLITAVSFQIESYCNNNLTAQDYSEYYNVDLSTTLLVLKQTPVQTVTQVTLDPYGETPQVIDGSSFIVESKSGVIRLKPTLPLYMPYFPCGFQSVKVDYSAGYATIPNDLQLQCAIGVQNAYRQINVDVSMFHKHIGEYQYQRNNALANVVLSDAIKASLTKYKHFV